MNFRLFISGIVGFAAGALIGPYSLPLAIVVGVSLGALIGTL